MYHLPPEPMKSAKPQSELDSIGHPVTVEPSGYQTIPAHQQKAVM